MPSVGTSACKAVASVAPATPALANCKNCRRVFVIFASPRSIVPLCHPRAVVEIGNLANERIIAVRATTALARQVDPKLLELFGVIPPVQQIPLFGPFGDFLLLRSDLGPRRPVHLVLHA